MGGYVGGSWVLLSGAGDCMALYNTMMEDMYDTSSVYWFRRDISHDRRTLESHIDEVWSPKLVYRSI